MSVTARLDPRHLFPMKTMNDTLNEVARDVRADTSGKRRPSASNMQRLKDCPGSWAAQEGLADEPSFDSERGTRVHAALAKQDENRRIDESQCDDAEEIEIAERLAKKEALLVERWAIGLEGLADMEFSHMPSVSGQAENVFRECRMWLEQDGVKRFSGQADAIFLAGTHTLIIDYKTGWGEVEESPSNLQLRALAVLAYATWGACTITVAIITPNGDPQMCRYTAADLERSEKEILAIIAAAEAPDAPRIPSEDACRYCRAKGTAHCPESLAVLPAVIQAGEGEIVDVRQMVRLWEIGKVAMQIIKANEARLKALPLEVLQAEGVTLKPGNKVRQIKDAGAAWVAALPIIPKADFLRCMEVGISDLEKAHKSATGLKGNAAADDFAARFGHLITTTQNSPSLVRA